MMLIKSQSPQVGAMVRTEDQKNIYVEMLWVSIPSSRGNGSDKTRPKRVHSFPFVSIPSSRGNGSDLIKGAVIGNSLKSQSPQVGAMVRTIATAAAAAIEELSLNPLKSGQWFGQQLLHHL